MVVVCRMVIVAVIVVMRPGVLRAFPEAKPGADIRRPPGGVGRGERENPPRCQRVGRHDRRGGVQPAQGPAKARRRVATGLVGLRQHQQVGHRGLRRASSNRFRWSPPCTASMTVTTPLTVNSARIRSVAMKPRNTGPGSASPVVSITTRLNIGPTPRSASSASRSSVNRTSPETVQHRHPVVVAKARSSAKLTSAPSMSWAPNSLTMIAVSPKPGRAISRLSRRFPGPEKAGEDGDGNAHQLGREEPGWAPAASGWATPQTRAASRATSCC